MTKAAQWRWSISAAAVVMMLAACEVRTASVAAEKPKFPFQDAAVPMEKRAEDLVERMTLEEKSHRCRWIRRRSTGLACRRITGGARRCTAWRETARRRCFRRPLASRRRGIRTCIIGWRRPLALRPRAKHQEAARKGCAEFTRVWICGRRTSIFSVIRGWGRGQETYGEDPYLTGRLGVAFVTGSQGK